MNDTSAVARKPITANRRQILVGGAAVAAVGLTLTRPSTAHAATTTPLGATSRPPAGVDRSTIQRWARDTWASMAALAHPATGLPADNMSGPLSSPTRSGYTSPTNIGGYMWSAVIAREMGIISAAECRTRLTQTLTTLSKMKNHKFSGMFYNWYDESNGHVVTVWPENGTKVDPFLSSVDNGWFAAALMTVRNAEPGVADLANALLDKMNFGMYFN
ncbi:MAG: DUF3131 domain-containing protein, partial [Actinobacteria bacterium]|nr:DUF3131 domain-containing protein [Actinomycetota bacterium]